MTASLSAEACSTAAHSGTMHIRCAKICRLPHPYLQLLMTTAASCQRSCTIPAAPFRHYAAASCQRSCTIPAAPFRHYAAASFQLSYQALRASRACRAQQGDTAAAIHIYNRAAAPDAIHSCSLSPAASSSRMQLHEMKLPLQIRD